MAFLDSSIDTSLARLLVESLPSGMPGLFNPWKERCVHDTASNGPEQRLERLARYLNCKPRVILIGEAPGYQGCRYSGIAFTSERLLLEGVIPRIQKLDARLCNRRLPFSEPSATIVWKVLNALNLSENTILWNALQLHPFKEVGVWSNRTPSPAEFKHGEESVKRLIAQFPNAQVVAIGQKASLLLTEIGITPSGVVRHPANGGATKFRDGLKGLFG